MKILITGGAGFIGSHLSEKLLKNGHQIFVLDNLSTGSLDNIKHLLLNKNFHFKKGSILNAKLVKDLVKKVDQIYHLAAVVGVKKVVFEPIKTIETNLKGTEIVLKSASLFNQKKKVLIASSSEVYGKNLKIPFKEEDDRILGPTSDPRWTYSSTKALDEFLALAYFKEKGLKTVVVRLFNIVGPRQTDAYGMVIPNFVKNALLLKPLLIFGDGKQTRSFTHVDDAINAMIKLMNNKKAEGKIFNLGQNYEISINDLAKKVLKLTKSKSKIIHAPFEKTYSPTSASLKKRCPDISKIKKIIKFFPKKNLDDILKGVIDYYQRKLKIKK